MIIIKISLSLCVSISFTLRNEKKFNFLFHHHHCNHPDHDYGDDIFLNFFSCVCASVCQHNYFNYLMDPEIFFLSLGYDTNVLLYVVLIVIVNMAIMNWIEIWFISIGFPTKWNFFFFWNTMTSMRIYDDQLAIINFKNPKSNF